MVQGHDRVGIAARRVLPQPADGVVGLGDHERDRIADDREDLVTRPQPAAVQVGPELHMSVDEDALVEDQRAGQAAQHRQEFVIRQPAGAFHDRGQGHLPAAEVHRQVGAGAFRNVNENVSCQFRKGVQEGRQDAGAEFLRQNGLFEGGPHVEPGRGEALAAIAQRPAHHDLRNLRWAYASKINA